MRLNFLNNYLIHLQGTPSQIFLELMLISNVAASI